MSLTIVEVGQCLQRTLKCVNHRLIVRMLDYGHYANYENEDTHNRR